MAIIRNIIDTEEIRRRAAEIRRHWSAGERRQRTGLPPDLPPRLRQWILGASEPAWSTASGRPQNRHQPLW